MDRVEHYSLSQALDPNCRFLAFEFCKTTLTDVVIKPAERLIVHTDLYFFLTFVADDLSLTRHLLQGDRQLCRLIEEVRQLKARALLCIDGAHEDALLDHCELVGLHFLESLEVEVAQVNARIASDL